MFAEGLSMAFSSVLSVIFFVVAVAVYVALVRQIGMRSPIENGSIRKLGLPEAVVAALLVLFLLSVAIGGAETNLNRIDQLNNWLLLENLLIEIGIVLIIAFFLMARGFDIDALGGFSKMSLRRALSIAVVLLVLVYPLLGLAEVITESFLKVPPSKQAIVELFTLSGSIEQRILIIVFAVAAAPPIEEFLFRFFLYGVLRRYFGRLLGAVLNALLFAAIHTHLPSFAPLFVLGLCLTVAYEWSGSILVSMTMHALFNAASLTLLAFPEMVPQ